ncbi:hypothetical protein [Actinopolymorpha pittospori]|uniref:DUF7246 domain-containing protein n=1 Tax=Actinopolymorpha pittospori TaxID=648752 RepID=A0A927N038_9ACTN|nr:hypothetical protein [Actinopolymorpha pittospori]MBE1606265.1 hypothetical protein [Actinopolymorpha pittospori]
MNTTTTPRRRRRPRLSAYPLVPHVDPSASWTRHLEWRVNGRILAPGAEVSIRGERGRFRFLYAVEKPDGLVWLEFLGGSKGSEVFRSFYPSRVRTVHRIAKTRANLAPSKGGTR